MSLGVGLAL
ncbi:hypothetical protein Gpo141_00014030, partial [Globisporangium polare]